MCVRRPGATRAGRGKAGKRGASGGTTLDIVQQRGVPLPCIRPFQALILETSERRSTDEAGRPFRWQSPFLAVHPQPYPADFFPRSSQVRKPLQRTFTTVAGLVLGVGPSHDYEPSPAIASSGWPGHRASPENIWDGSIVRVRRVGH